MEGVFDASLLQVRGDARVAASVAAQVSGLQVETLKHHRIKRVYICGDPDGGGDRGTMANIAAQERAGIQAFVVPRLPGCDPDEFVIQNGIDAWLGMVARSQHCFEFRAPKIVEKHRTSEGWTSAGLAAAIDEAIKFDSETGNPERETDLDLFFWKTIVRETGVSPDALAARLKVVRGKKANEQERRQYEDILRQADEALTDGNLPHAKRILQENVSRLKNRRAEADCRAVRRGRREIPAHVDRIERYRGAEFIGLVQRTLGKLDQYTLGLRI